MNTVNGAIISKGNSNPIIMYDPNVFIMINVAGIKLYLKTGAVPTKAASHAMLGNVG